MCICPINPEFYFHSCDYLFIDSYDNVIINPNGLFHRYFVFNNMGGIKHTSHTYNN